MHLWEPFSSIHPGELNSKQLTYHQWCAPPTRALVMRSTYTLPKYMLIMFFDPLEVP